MSSFIENENENETENPSEKPRTAQYATKKGEIVLRPHVYDGIEEYDQKLPNWWLFTFFGAILIYLVYWVIYYQTGLMKTDQEIVTTAMSEIQVKKQKDLEAALADLDDTTLVDVWAADASLVAEGASIYNQVCIGCHGPGLDAPNKLGLSLVDGEWKYGDRPMDLFKLINEGTPADSAGMAPTGARMAPYGSIYNPKQIATLIAFIISKNKNDFAKFSKN